MKENIERLLTAKKPTNYAISKATGIAQATLSDYATGKSDIGNMKLDHAIKLNEYYLKLKEEMKMKQVYENLLKVVDESKLSENGHYLSFYNSVDLLKEEVEFDDFGEWFESKFNVPVDEVDGSFITFDSDSASDGYIYTDTETAYDDIIWFLKNESRYKKYVNREKV